MLYSKIKQKRGQQVHKTGTNDIRVLPACKSRGIYSDINEIKYNYSEVHNSNDQGEKEIVRFMEIFEL